MKWISNKHDRQWVNQIDKMTCVVLCGRDYDNSSFGISNTFEIDEKCEYKHKTYFPMQQATEKWTNVRVSSDSKNRTKVENHLSTTSNLNLNGFGSVGERQANTKNIGQEVNALYFGLS